MNPPRVLLSLLLIGGVLGGAVHPQTAGAQVQDTAQADAKEKGAPYVPTANRIVWKMLKLADVGKDDVVYDLGSGDGRIVITAAKHFDAQGVGIEIDPELVKEARRKARQAGVADKVTFHQGDLFDADLSDATVVTLYLWPDMNNRLRPKLQSELDPGDRVVSNSFDIDDWPADSSVSMGTQSVTSAPKTLFLWRVTDSTGAK